MNEIIPAVKSKVKKTITTVTFVDGVVVELVGSDTIATRKAAYLKAKPPVVIPPVVTTSPYKSSFRLSKAFAAFNPKEQGFKDGENVGVVKDFVGGNDLKFNGRPTLSLSGVGGSKYIDGAGIFLQNEDNSPYSAPVKLKATYPVEQIFVFIKYPYFLCESFLKFSGNYCYGGDIYENAMRVDSDGLNRGGVNDWELQGAKWPLNEYFTLRSVHTLPAGAKKANVDWYINNIKIPVDAQKMYWIAQNSTIGFGSETNGEYMGVQEYLFFDRLLTTEEASKIQSEIMSAYPKPNNPIVNNIRFSVADGKRKVDYDFFSPLGLKEDITKRIVKVVEMPNNSPTNCFYNQYKDLTFPTGFFGRVEITVFDTAGNRSILPGSKMWGSL